MRASNFKFALLIMASVFSGNSSAQTCPCNYMVCAICVETTLPAIKTATETAFNSLGTLHETMDQTIEVGVNAESRAITNYKNNIVSALMADSNSLTTSIEKSAIMEQRLFDGLKTSIDEIQKSALVAKSNLHAAENYGVANVSHATKSISNSQYASVIGKSEIDDFLIDGSIKADIPFYIDILNNRKQKFIDSILVPNTDNTNLLSVVSVIKAGEKIDYTSDVITEGDWVEALGYRRFLSIPTEIQSDIRPEDLRSYGDSDFAPIRARSKIVAEYHAWEMALKSEIKTDQGPTSLYNFIASTVKEIYESDDGIIDAAQSGERELLNTIATNEAIGGVIDILLLEVQTHILQMEGAKLGSMVDEKYNTFYGYEDISQINNQIDRSNHNE
jgi:hypothetical protein